MLLVTTLYIFRVVPTLADFGRSRWQERIFKGEPPLPGGPFAEVNESTAVLLSLVYVSMTFLALSRMERQLPVQSLIFEALAVHNVTQSCYNFYCRLKIWGKAKENR